MKIFPVILCGGFGTRMWPLSRTNLPKQFIKLFKGKSLFQNSLAQVMDETHYEKPYLLTNNQQKYLIKEQLREMGVTDAVIFLEPAPLSTAPATTVAAMEIAKKDPNGIMVLLSSDNEIKRREDFEALIPKAAKVAKEKNIYLLFGSKAEYAETGYGYIKGGEVLFDHDKVHISKIERFVEKPQAPEADKCMKEGYQWNSGIFIIPVKLYLEEMEKYSPEIYNACKETMRVSKIKKWHNQKLVTLNKKEFMKSPVDSLDYAVMEKTKHSAVVRTDIGWYDVGSWQSFYEISEKDNIGNASYGDILAIDVKNTNIFSSDKSRITAAVGVENLTIIQTADATLVMPTSKSQEVKKIVAELKVQNKGIFLTDPVTYKKWGFYEIVRREAEVVLKKITLKPKHKVLIKGNNKAKHFVVTKGVATFYIGRAKMIVQENDSLMIPMGVDYNINNLGDARIEIIKIETKDYISGQNKAKVA